MRKSLNLWKKIWENKVVNSWGINQSKLYENKANTSQEKVMRRKKSTFYERKVANLQERVKNNEKKVVKCKKKKHFMR